eukprot:531713-Pleurochrysis_carterae.AAC.3
MLCRLHTRHLHIAYRSTCGSIAARLAGGEAAASAHPCSVDQARFLSHLPDPLGAEPLEGELRLAHRGAVHVSATPPVRMTLNRR